MFYIRVSTNGGVFFDKNQWVSKVGLFYELLIAWFQLSEHGWVLCETKCLGWNKGDFLNLLACICQLPLVGEFF